MIGLFSSRETIEVTCDIEIEKTQESFHAYSIPEGIEIREGDIMMIHGAPTQIPFGERITMECRATVMRAGPLARAWTRLTSMLELTELYEVGFQPKEQP
jgi:hypothetical protein